MAPAEVPVPAELVHSYASFAISGFQAKHLEKVYLRYLDTRIKVIMTLCNFHA